MWDIYRTNYCTTTQGPYSQLFSPDSSQIFHLLWELVTSNVRGRLAPSYPMGQKGADRSWREAHVFLWTLVERLEPVDIITGSISLTKRLKKRTCLLQPIPCHIYKLRSLRSNTSSHTQMSPHRTAAL